MSEPQELSREQMEHQDAVDNAIVAMLNEVNPTPDELDYLQVAELVATIRESIIGFFETNGICTEMDFYPYLEDPPTETTGETK